MTLETVTVNIERDTETDDGYGGVTAVSANVYAGLKATINFPTGESNRRAESGAQGAVGPGVVTRYTVVVKFEPYPTGKTFRVNDRVYVPATGERYKVVAVRPYTYTLQLDAERLV